MKRSLKHHRLLVLTQHEAETLWGLVQDEKLTECKVPGEAQTLAALEKKLTRPASAEHLDAIIDVMAIAEASYPAEVFGTSEGDRGGERRFAKAMAALAWARSVR